MKQLLILALLTLPVATHAQTEPEEPVPLEGWAEQTERMLRDFMQGIQPEMQDFVGRMLPRLKQLGEMMGGLSNYEMPEVLPNGDIIIRRKEDAPPLPQDFSPNDDPIEL